MIRDLPQELQQLVSSNLSSLIDYYIEVSVEKGPGVLLVNYYPDSDLVDSDARFLKSAQISQFIQDSGMDELQSHFDSHDPQTQMVMIAISEAAAGVLTVDVTRPEGKESRKISKRSKPRGFG